MTALEIYGNGSARVRLFSAKVLVCSSLVQFVCNRVESWSSTHQSNESDKNLSDLFQALFYCLFGS